MRRYLLTEEAHNDLAEIRDYLKHEAGAQVAKTALGRIKAAIRFLSRTPGAGHIREDLTDHPVKFWPVMSYLLVYNPESHPIEIIRVIHGSREIAALLAKNDG